MNTLRRIIYLIIIQIITVLYFFCFVSFFVVLYIYLYNKGFNIFELFMRIEQYPLDKLTIWLPEDGIKYLAYVQKQFTPFIVIPIFVRVRSKFYLVNNERFLTFLTIICTLNYFFVIFPQPRIIDVLVIILYNIAILFFDPLEVDAFFNLLIMFWHNLFIPFLLLPVLYTNIDIKFIFYLLIFIVIMTTLFFTLPI